ncbi:unnamed protein product [Calicophoron daubneyi]|uniref:MACPF domain-containing protein n=1 Tax=Calicophoron daubneyi TaxID=300641 RepID=A0AAV2T6Q0_CALDB
MHGIRGGRVTVKFITPLLLVLSIGLIPGGHAIVVSTVSTSKQVSTERLQAQTCNLREDGRILDVVPGVGWDNLVNEERGPTIDRDQYTKCYRSSDGKILIPDDMILEPKGNSQLDLTSEVFDSTTECRSLTAFSVNSAVEFGFSFVTINGDFSLEKEHMREQYATTKGLIVRSQLRHRRYSVKLLPDSTLHPRFRNRLLDIAAHLERGNITEEQLDEYDRGENGLPNHMMPVLNNNELNAYSEGMRAFYLADLVIRDYGTHSISSVDAGGILVKTDTLDESSVSMNREERLQVASSASAKFAQMLSVKIGASVTLNNTETKKYSEKVTHSRVTSHGGPIFRASSMNLSEWEDGLDDRLVAIDRSGTPIYELVTLRSLPELSEHLILRLGRTLKSAVERYYRANAVIGCMDPSSVFYDNQANVASSECRGENAQLDEQVRLPFGGTYQKCEGTPDLCSTVAVKNPATGDFTCPIGYISVQLLPAQVRNCYSRCESSAWKRSSECHQQCATSVLFWCARDPSLSSEITDNGGFVFGGLYTDQAVNPVTHQFTCPEYNWPLSMGRRMRVCLSADRELGGKHALPFGGFYSCQYGNPLVPLLEQNGTGKEMRAVLEHFIGDQRNVDKLDVKLRSHLNGTERRVENSTTDYSELFSTIWPKRCPKGYTAHLAAMEDTCQVNFCVPANFMKGERKRYLKRPPFVTPPIFYGLYSNDGGQMKTRLSIDGADGKRLERIGGDWVRTGIPTGGSDNAHQERVVTMALSGTLAVVICILIAILVLGVIYYRRRTVH